MREPRPFPPRSSEPRRPPSRPDVPLNVEDVLRDERADEVRLYGRPLQPGERPGVDEGAQRWVTAAARWITAAGMVIILAALWRWLA